MGIENHFLAGKHSPFKQMNQKNVVNDEIPGTSEPSEGWLKRSPSQRLEMMIKSATSCWKRGYLIFKWTDLYCLWIDYPEIFLLEDFKQMIARENIVGQKSSFSNQSTSLMIHLLRLPGLDTFELIYARKEY